MLRDARQQNRERQPQPTRCRIALHVTPPVASAVNPAIRQCLLEFCFTGIRDFGFRQSQTLKLD